MLGLNVFNPKLTQLSHLLSRDLNKMRPNRNTLAGISTINMENPLEMAPDEWHLSPADE